MVGKTDFKENPKSDLDLDLGFVNYDENQYLGFKGRFPAQFSTMYNINDHPKVLAIQEFPHQSEHEEEQVFQEAASAQPPR